MNKQEFIDSVSAKSGVNKKATREVVKSMFDVIIDIMRNDDVVSPYPGVLFKSVWVEPHSMFMGVTGKTIDVDGKYRPVVKFTDSFKNKVNEE